MNVEGHGGDLIAGALRAGGVDRLYTLIGGHVLGVIEAADRQGMRLLDVRHESAAAFAAEAHGKLSRSPGVAVTDAGPGALNTVNAIASAASNGAPMVLLAGHPPTGTGGMGMLNETDQRSVFAGVAKESITAGVTDAIGPEVARALSVAASRHRGPVYLDVPMEVVAAPGSAVMAPAATAGGESVDGDLDAVVRALTEAERPWFLFGSDTWADGAEKAARELVEALGVPAYTNGMARGVVPGDHPLLFNTSRSTAAARGDLVVIVGTPLDFRVKFGGYAAPVVHVVDHPSVASRNGAAAHTLAGPIVATLEALAQAGTRDRSEWAAELRAIEEQKRAGHRAEMASDAFPIHPSRVYGELIPRLRRDAMLIADGGDFASYAGRYLDVYEPGGWLDPGPYGCLGTSAGYALAAGSLNPGRQIVVLLGDGAAGFSLADWDSLVRHDIDVTFVCGNNGVWGLEKAPMQAMFGREVAVELAPETRYDQVMAAFGGHGELVREPGEIGPALDRAFATSGPSLVNVITDPDVIYPRGA